MASVVYVLCALTSVVCAWLLLRGWLASRARLLLWSSLCFAGLALNNVILFLDRVVVTDIDLSLARLGSGFAGVVILFFFFILEGE